jgi:hypothetical protein
MTAPPRQNRVQPDGSFAAVAARGSLTGNRGILHDAHGRIGPARWRHKAWISCLLQFKSRRAPLNAPGHYTHLFFHDEAVACAAGHRPCAECRRADYIAFQAAFRRAFGGKTLAPEMDRILHAGRVDPATRTPARHMAQIDSLPDGCFVVLNDTPHLLRGEHVYPFAPYGYGAPLNRPTRGAVTVLTPPPMVAVFCAGFVPQISGAPG